jgi:hypothetical protein
MNSGNVGSATLTVRETTRSAPCESAKSQLDAESGSRVGKGILIFFVATIETGICFVNEQSERSRSAGIDIFLNADWSAVQHIRAWSAGTKTVTACVVGASTAGDCCSAQIGVAPASGARLNRHAGWTRPRRGLDPSSDGWVLSEGKPIPPGIRVTAGADQAWDSQMAGIGADGGFEFHGLPPGFREYIRRSRDIAPAAMEFGVEEALDKRNITGLVIRMEPAPPLLQWEACDVSTRIPSGEGLGYGFILPPLPPEREHLRIQTGVYFQRRSPVRES